MQKQLLEISLSNILKIILLLVGLYFLYLIKDIIAIVFVAIIIAAGFSTTVDRWAKKGIPRTISVILIYCIILALGGAFIYFILPPLITQLKQLANQLPAYFDHLSRFVSSIRTFGTEKEILASSQQNLITVSNFLSQLVNNIFNVSVGFFNGAAAIAVIFILTLYFLLEENGIKKFLVSLLPVKQKTQIVKISNKIGIKLGSWLRGELILMAAIGIITYIGLLIMGIPYALTLAIIAGLFEIIPILGPILAAIPAVLMALFISPTMALVVAVFYILVQEAENKILVPKVMQYSVGLNPVTIIIILMIGAKLMGILGMLLAVPVASVIYVIFSELTVFTKPKVGLKTNKK